MSTRASPANAPIGEAAAYALANAFVAMPAIIVSYDSATKTVTVQPVSNRPLDDEDGIVTWVEWPQIQNVPVGFFGCGAMSLTAELVKGDVVWLVFADYSFAGWRRSGKVSDAGDTRNHGPSYPIAFPWYRPNGGAGSDTDNSVGNPGGVRMRFPDPNAAVVTQTPAQASEFVALKPAIDTLQTGHDGHTHGTPWGPTTTPVAPIGPLTSSNALKAGK